MDSNRVSIGAGALVYGGKRYPPVLGKLRQLAQVVMGAALHPGAGVCAEGGKRSIL